MSEGKRWNKQEIILLIQCYEESPVLWDETRKDYLDRGQKADAIKQIAEKINATDSEVSRKIHNLRSQLQGECRKMLAKKSGQGGKVYQSKWEFYEQLKFLVGRSHRTESNLVSTLVYY